MNRFVPLILFALMVGIFAAFLLDDERNPKEIKSVLIGKPAPAFTLPGLAAGDPEFSIANLQEGEVTIVNFFASWCVPCRAEHHNLMRLSEMDGVRLYGIAWKDPRAASAAFLDELGDPFALTGSDESGRTGIDWGITGVPETFIIDGKGVIRYRHWGPIVGDSLEVNLLPALRDIMAEEGR